VVHDWTPGGLIEKWGAASVGFAAAQGDVPGCTARILPTKATWAAVLQPCLRGMQTARIGGEDVAEGIGGREGAV
jgi:hypothetical protein